MNQIKGHKKQVKGAIKEFTGKILGKKILEQEGRVEKTAGKIQADCGDVESAIKEEL